jgi:hypothetical protein
VVVWLSLVQVPQAGAARRQTGKRLWLRQSGGTDQGPEIVTTDVIIWRVRPPDRAGPGLALITIGSTRDV